MNLSNLYGKSIIELLLIVLSCLLVSSQSMATLTKNQPDPYQALKQNLSHIKTLQADFNQTTQDSKGRTLQTSSGSMKVKRSALFRWNITDPFPQLLISNGNKIWIYDKQLQQVSIRATDQKTSTIPAAILSGDITGLTKNYFLKLIHKQNNETFVLTPKSEDSLFETLQIIFNNHHLTTMKFSDSLGTHTTIDFKNVKKNAPISDDLFTFKPPKGVDILDETKS